MGFIPSRRLVQRYQTSATATIRAATRKSDRKGSRTRSAASARDEQGAKRKISKQSQFQSQGRAGRARQTSATADGSHVGPLERLRQNYLESKPRTHTCFNTLKINHKEKKMPRNGAKVTCKRNGAKSQTDLGVDSSMGLIINLKKNLAVAVLTTKTQRLKFCRRLANLWLRG